VTSAAVFYMLKEENGDWIHLVQDRFQWLALNMVMNLWVP
jgi:hypothetical protein